MVTKGAASNVSAQDVQVRFTKAQTDKPNFFLRVQLLISNLNSDLTRSLIGSLKPHDW